MGKSSAAEVIAAEAFKLGFIPVLENFAKPIKEEAKEKGYDKGKYPRKYRKYCQDRGATARIGDPDHWVNLMKERLNGIREEESRDLNTRKRYWERVIIVDDCRYLNELGLGREYDGKLIFLSSGKRKIRSAKWRNHESEDLAKSVDSNKKDYLDLFDCILNNDSTEKIFLNKVRDFVPVWCGLQAEDFCDCPACRAKRNGQAVDLLTDLIDLLDVDIELEHDCEEDDEET